MTFKKPKLKYIFALSALFFVVFSAVFFVAQPTAQAYTAGSSLAFDQIKVTTTESIKNASGTFVDGVNSMRIYETGDGNGVTFRIKVAFNSPATMVTGNQDGYNDLSFPGLNATGSATIYGFLSGATKDLSTCKDVSTGFAGIQVASCDLVSGTARGFGYGFGTYPSAITYKAGSSNAGGPTASNNSEVGSFVYSDITIPWSQLQSDLGIKETSDTLKYTNNCFQVPTQLTTSVPQNWTQAPLWWATVLANTFGAETTFDIKDANRVVCLDTYKTAAEAVAADAKGPLANADETQVNKISGTNPAGGGSTIGDLINTIITYLVLAQTRIIYWAFANVVAPLIEGLLQVHPYQDVFVEAIYLGWQLIRNLCNIFFIVIMLVIGLGTLFRIESYNYKHLLVKVVIAALLVNFSLVFGQAILGVADTVQQQFLPDSANVIRALGSKLMVEPINELTQQTNFLNGDNATAGASFASITRPVFAFALALGAFFCFLALAAFLVIRLVALWILLLVSPLAYVANILPQTQSYSKQWWQHFLKYAFMTPVLAFFLNLSAVFVTTVIKDQASFSKLLVNQNVSGDIPQFVYLAGSQVLTILFILVGLKAASSSGTYGAAAVTNFAEKGMRKPFEWAGKGIAGLSKAGAERGFEAVQNKAGITLDPRLLKKAGSEYFAESKAKRLLTREQTPLFGMTNGPHFGSAKSNFEAYANLRGIKRATWDSKFGLRGATYNQHKLEEAEAKAHAYTDEELEEQMNKKAQLEHQLLNFETEKTKQVEKQKKLQEDITRMENDLAKGLIPATKRAAYQREIDQKKQDVQNLDTQIKTDFSDNKEKELKEETAEVAKGLLEDAQNKGRFGFDSITPEQKEEAHKQAEALEKRVSLTKRPEGYAAIAAHHHLLSDEEKKISHIEDSDRLVQLYKDALAQGDRYKAEAVMHKLAKDTNFNELATDLEGGMSFDKTKKILENFQETFGLDKHSMLEVASEIGYINEGVHMFNGARLTKIDKHGHMDWATPKQHEDAITAQMKKIEPQGQARQLWRGSFVDEDEDEHGKKTFTLHNAGIAILRDSLAKGEGISHVAGRMQEYNRHAVLEGIERGVGKGNIDIDNLANNKEFMDALRFGKRPSSGSGNKKVTEAAPPNPDDD